MRTLHFALGIILGALGFFAILAIALLVLAWTQTFFYAIGFYAIATIGLILVGVALSRRMR